MQARTGRWGWRALILVVAMVLVGQPAEAQKRKTTTSYGDEITTYVRPPASRMLRVSFQRQAGRLDGAAFDRALSDSLKSMAETAREQSSEVFAVTNMFCSAFSSYGAILRSGCAMEGAWLKPNERIETKAKDNSPIYFSTAAVLAGRIPMGWYQRLDTMDGLTGKVKIVPIAAGDPPLRILGA